jgi:hypothetical protein
MRSPTFEWVSGVLNTQLSPDLIILVGLNGLMNNPKIAQRWNDRDGLKGRLAQPVTRIDI